MSIQLKLLDKGTMLLRKELGTGEVNGVKMAYGIAVPGAMYVEYKDRIVIIDRESLCTEAVEIIEEAGDV